MIVDIFASKNILVEDDHVLTKNIAVIIHKPSNIDTLLGILEESFKSQEV